MQFYRIQGVQFRYVLLYNLNRSFVFDYWINEIKWEMDGDVNTAILINDFI